MTALSVDDFRPLAVTAAAIYGAAMRKPPEIVVQRREVIGIHLGYPGFVASGAFDTASGAFDTASGAVTSDDLVGFCYGYRGAPGQWWYDVIAPALGRRASEQWLRHGFELAELHVLPDYHGQGLGRTLLLDVLSRSGCTRAVLSTPDIESPARSLYRAQGFADLLCDFHFPGSPEAYAIMGVDL